jgi:hypothetical protein
LQHIGRDAFHTVGHHGNPQIRAVGDQRRQERGQKIRETGRTFAWTAKRSRKIAPGIDLHQQILNAHQQERTFNSAMELYEPGWKVKGIALFQVLPILANGHERIARQSPFGLLGHLMKYPKVFVKRQSP